MQRLRKRSLKLRLLGGPVRLRIAVLSCCRVARELRRQLAGGPAWTRRRVARELRRRTMKKTYGHEKRPRHHEFWHSLCSMSCEFFMNGYGHEKRPRALLPYCPAALLPCCRSNTGAAVWLTAIGAKRPRAPQLLIYGPNKLYKCLIC